MGEYAIRCSDRQEIKIGTCESMYYLRADQRSQVLPLDGNVNVGLDSEATTVRFRFPFPDEDVYFKRPDLVDALNLILHKHQP